MCYKCVPPEGAYCRICGSRDLNVANYIPNLSDKLSLYQIVVGGHSLDRLFRPCNCRGEFAFAHQVCLSEWIETTKHEFCDVCKFRYNVHFLDRTVFDWLSETRQVSRVLRVLCTSALVYYVSSLGILNHFLSIRRPNNIISSIVLASSCIWMIFCTISLAVYAFWQWREFKDWQQTNRRVLVDENKEPQLEAELKKKDVLKSSGFKPA
jgi:hypothetical protein